MVICHWKVTKVFVSLLVLMNFVSSGSANASTAEDLLKVKLDCQLVPEFQDQIDRIKKFGSPLDTMTASSVPKIRADRDKAAAVTLAEIPIKQFEQKQIPSSLNDHSISVNVYTPADQKLARNQKLPILVFVHGGGWTLGSPTTYNSVTRFLANEIPSLVVSVDYRLAPEHQFPQGLDDVLDVLKWLSKHAADIGGDSDRMAIAGDSGGGNLSTVAAMKARELKEIHIRHQTLFYPSTNISKTEGPTYQDYGVGYPLSKKAVELFRSFYLPNQKDWTDPEASPLQAADLRHMPPATIITAGCDVLRDEGHAYAVKLAQAGVPVNFKNESGMTHAYLSYFNYDKKISPYGQKTLVEAATDLRRVFEGKVGRHH